MPSTISTAVAEATCMCQTCGAEFVISSTTAVRTEHLDDGRVAVAVGDPVLDPFAVDAFRAHLAAHRASTLVRWLRKLTRH